MRFRNVSLPLLAVAVLSSALYVVNQRRVALVLKERRAIEKTYNSPLYVSAALNRFERDPGTQSSLGGDITEWTPKAVSKNIEAFSLKGDTATVVVNFRFTYGTINSHTKKRHCYDAIAVQKDIWHKQKGKWSCTNSTIILFGSNKRQNHELKEKEVSGDALSSLPVPLSRGCQSFGL